MNARKYRLFQGYLLLSLIGGLSGNVWANDLQQNTEQLQNQIIELRNQINQLQHKVQHLEQDQAQTKLFKSPTEKTTTTPDKKSNYGMEKCTVVDEHGNGLIKPYMADSGSNLEGDRYAWIWVPHGQCKKINRGDLTGVSNEVRSKIHSTNLNKADTFKPGAN